MREDGVVENSHGNRSSIVVEGLLHDDSGPRVIQFFKFMCPGGAGGPCWGGGLPRLYLDTKYQGYPDRR